MTNQRGEAAVGERQRDEQVVDHRDEHLQDVDDHGADRREATATVHAPGEHQHHRGGQKGAQHTSGHEDAQQIELKEAALCGVIGQAVGEHDIIDGIGTHEQAERAQRAGMVGRGDRGKRPQGHDGRDRAEDSTTFQYGDELPRAHAAGGFGFVLGREVTGVATIQQHHQNGDVTKQSDTTAHQSIAVGAGRHECTDDQYHRAERELLAGDESDILIGQTDAVTQADADDQTTEGTHQRHHDGTHNAHMRFGDGQHEDDQQRAAEHLQHASGQNQRN